MTRAKIWINCWKPVCYVLKSSSSGKNSKPFVSKRGFTNLQQILLLYTFHKTVLLRKFATAKFVSAIQNINLISDLSALNYPSVVAEKQQNFPKRKNQYQKMIKWLKMGLNQWKEVAFHTLLFSTFVHIFYLELERITKYVST